MTNEKVIAILQEDLERKCEDVDIYIFSYPNVVNTIEYVIIDKRTGAKEYLEVERNYCTGEDCISKAMNLYDQLLACAQRLLNARCDKNDNS